MPYVDNERVTKTLFNHCLNFMQHFPLAEVIAVCTLCVDPLSKCFNAAVSARGQDLPSQLTLTVPVP